jgi:hypothetical protein
MNIVKWHFYGMTSVNKHHPYPRVSRRLESIYILQGNNLITWQTWVTQTPWVATVHDDYQRVKPGPPYPSACLPRDTSTGIRGWPPHYPNVHPLSMVGCRPTLRSLKLLSLWDTIILYASVHNQSCSPGSDDRSSIDTDRGYHLRPNIKTHHSPPFPSCILHFPLVALPVLI